MQLFHVIFAQTAPTGPAGPSGFGTIFMFGSILLIWYFVLIRPQSKQRKEHEASINALKKGDHVVTAGGIVGEVVHIKVGEKDGQPAPGAGDHVTIRSGESKLVVTRGRIASIGSAEAKA